MLDIKRIREDPKVFKDDLKKRGWDPKLVDELLQYDAAWRQASAQINDARAERNSIGRAFGPLMGAYKKLDALGSNLEASIVVVNEYLNFRQGAGAIAKWLLENRKRRQAMQAVVDFCSLLEDVNSAARKYDEAFKSFFTTVGEERGVALATSDQQTIADLSDKLEHARVLRDQCTDYASIPKPASAQVERHIKTIVASPLWPIDELWKLVNDIRDRHAAPRDLATKATERVRRLERTIEQAQERRSELLRSLPNLMHDSVPEGKDESDNVPLRSWGGAPTHDFQAISHVDLLDSLDLADLERAARAAGSRFYYAKGDLVMLGRALEFHALQKLRERGFTPIEPPFMLRREAVEGAVDLSDFEDVIYRVEAGAGRESGEDAPELFLIATSEHPLAAMHMGEIIERERLPLRYAGISPCFRKEAGAHGRDQKGIFRVHQFSKVEQFVYSDVDDSWGIHEELLANAESIYRDLGIPHRVVTICTGDLGTVAAKKYDIEAWMPVQGTYREVVSCSNCTDYQARRYNTRTRDAPGEPTRFVHTLNSTAVAVQRTLVAILENFQEEDGSVVIPAVLRPYVGKDRIGAL